MGKTMMKLLVVNKQLIFFLSPVTIVSSLQVPEKHTCEKEKNNEVNVVHVRKLLFEALKEQQSTSDHSLLPSGRTESLKILNLIDIKIFIL